MGYLKTSLLRRHLSKREQRLALISFVLLGASVLMMWTIVPGSASSEITIGRVPNPPLALDLTSLPGDLRAIPVPTPSNLGDYVRDEALARALGKALFWDMQ